MPEAQNVVSQAYQKCALIEQRKQPYQPRFIEGRDHFPRIAYASERLR
jgi:hypothetical protein